MMQQICLMGEHATTLALRLFSALSLRAVGYRLMPFRIAGRDKGYTMHLLIAPEACAENDVPCILRLSSTHQVVVREVYDEIAATALRHCRSTHAPILLDTLTAESLACESFRKAVAGCLNGSQPVIAIVAPDAREALTPLFHAEQPLWLTVKEDNEEDMLVRLQGELNDRL